MNIDQAKIRIEELKNAIFIHTNFEPNQLSQKLLLAATNGGAKALGLQKGILEKDYDADIISFTLPDSIEDKDDLATAIILHTSQTTHTFTGGKNELLK